MEKISYPKEIHSFLNEAVLIIRKALNPEYILITGSFGKGSWLYSGNQLISDFEIVFVCNKYWSLKTKEVLLKSLNNEYPYDISLKGFLIKKIQKKVVSNYSYKNPGYLTLDYFDSFSYPKLLYSKHNESINININVNEVPAWEAWRLYVNRMGDILSLTIVNKKQNQNYYWLKMYESTADAYLIVNKLYEKNIDKRRNLFTEELVKGDKDLDNICKESFSKIKLALEARVSHNLSVFDIPKFAQEESFKIINSWMNYFQNKMIQDEDIEFDFDLGNSYNNKLHNKYLETSFKKNVLLSNTIKLIHKPFLINRNFKFYHHHNSWRHIILLTIASTFKEYSNDEFDFTNSKKLLSKIVNKKSIFALNSNDFIIIVMKYWKLLR